MTEPVLSRSTVDRDSAGREDEAALAAAWPSSRVLVVDQAGQALVDGTDLVLVDAASAPAGERFYLGKDEDARYFAVVVDELPRRLGAMTLGLREAGAALSDRDAGLLVHAVGLAHWHRMHPRCPRCGAATESRKGGHTRRCVEDATEHFPRSDPAIIVLVTDGADRAVLGRQHVWPERRFSTLAGFVEPGESLEQAVVREVREESSLDVRDVVYRGSQPWPFPASLMLGFRALVDADAVPAVGDDELAEVRWFTRQQLREAQVWDGTGAGEVFLPPSISIAHSLIAEWVAEG